MTSRTTTSWQTQLWATTPLLARLQGPRSFLPRVTQSRYTSMCAGQHPMGGAGAVPHHTHHGTASLLLLSAVHNYWVSCICLRLGHQKFRLPAEGVADLWCLLGCSCNLGIGTVSAMSHGRSTVALFLHAHCSLPACLHAYLMLLLVLTLTLVMLLPVCPGPNRRWRLQSSVHQKGQ